MTYTLIDESPSEEHSQFTPAIFDSHHLNENVPAGFNTVKIVIDGRADGSLDWKQSRLAALNAIGKGLKILWDIDLGLPDRLHAPLSDQTQYLALGLSLDHFRDTLWHELHKHSIGLCLYRGSADFASQFPWDSQQEKTNDKIFCRNAIAEYLDLLGQRLPDAIPLFIALDISSLSLRYEASELVNKDVFHRFQRFVTSGCIPAYSLTGYQIGWMGRNHIQVQSASASVGICIPQVGLSSHWEHPLTWIAEKQKAYRFIPESSLTAEWDGLDYLLVMSEQVSTQGLRKLRGFCAAGGTVITIGELLGLPHELKFIDWQKSLK